VGSNAMSWTTFGEGLKKLNFEHLDLRMSRSLEHLPSNRLGRVVELVTNRLIYENWIGHDQACIKLSGGWTRIDDYLKATIGKGTAARLLLGPRTLHIAGVPGCPRNSGVTLVCVECNEIVGQVEDDDPIAYEGFQLRLLEPEIARTLDGVRSAISV